jgi:hypothetical protein
MNKRITNLQGATALTQEGLAEFPQAWEDGQRLLPTREAFERWQFDASLEDGTTLLITFFNKPLFERSAVLRPGTAITLIQPDGKKYMEVVEVKPEDYSSSRERCYVRAGRSWVRGDDGWNYELDVQTETLGAHLNLKGIVPPWRPGAGKFLTSDGTGFFSWLAAVPYGKVDGLVSLNGKLRPIHGYGYHDHRWGTVDLSQVFSHWYIGHAQAGDCTLVFLEITTSPEYGEIQLPALLLTQGSRILASGMEPIQLIDQDYQPDEGGRSYPGLLQGCWETEQGRIRLVLRDPLPINSFSLVEFLPAWKRLVGELRTNPYHFTLLANLDLEISLPAAHSRYESSALLELALLR